MLISADITLKAIIQSNKITRNLNIFLSPVLDTPSWWIACYFDIWFDNENFLNKNNASILFTQKTYKNPELPNISIFSGYENEFKQVLLNIINNAKNKIVEKDLPINQKGKIDINIERCANFNTIEIIDDAGAIDEKIINSIFEPYFTTKEDGTGIGLYMAKIIIEDKMRGTINVRNNKDNVIFTIKLPHKKV